MARETQSARSSSIGSGDPGPSVSSAQTGIFRKEGEYWTIGYGGKAFRLKDTKGLGYLAHLLRYPAIEFHVLDLVGGIASQHAARETMRWRARLKAVRNCTYLMTFIEPTKPHWRS